jgi:hypothetical protein
MASRGLTHVLCGVVQAELTARRAELDEAEEMHGLLLTRHDALARSGAANRMPGVHGGCRD